MIGYLAPCMRDCIRDDKIILLYYLISVDTLVSSSFICLSVYISLQRLAVMSYLDIDVLVSR